MSRPRLFFLALPPQHVVDAIQAIVIEHRLDARLARDMFAPTNWHQSLSERIFNPSDAECASLQAVGATIAAKAHACTLSFNRIDAQLTDKATFHWTLRARGRPKAFDALLAAVQAALRTAGHHAIATGVTPHVTLSYSAPEMLQKIEVTPAIDWRLDELLLVIGGGSPYHYDIIGHWPLLPEIDPPQVQLGMF